MSKSQATNLETLREITGDVTESDFVPYSVHYDPETLLTKNGELLQIIKVTGFEHEDIESDDLDLRATIRNAIAQSIHTTDYALWLHTIRRKKPLSAGGEYPRNFSGYLNKYWREKNRFEDSFVNEVYITVVKEGQSGNILNPQGFLRALIPAAENSHRFAYLEKAHSELSEAVETMLEVLSHYGAKRLTVTEQDGVFYSEPCAFLGKLTTLIDRPWELPDSDISRYITDYDVTFGYNAMEVRSPDGKRRFGTMLTLKECKEIPVHMLDGVLQMPAEFIISQCIDFINHKKAIKEFAYQQAIFETSKKTDLMEKSGLKAILDSDRGTPVDFGEQQLSIFIIGDTLGGLDKQVDTTISSLTELGMIAMREDLRLEQCYWAQLPANFEFLKRLKPINTARYGTFANLSNFPAGQQYGNHWGEAATLFHTAARTPYFFNFHVGDNGHTTIIGPLGAGKTVLMNFLVSEARKFKPALYYFDQHRASEIFIRSLGGPYMSLDRAAPNRLAMNPLRLPDSPDNRRFLQEWLMTLIDPAAGRVGTHTSAFDAALTRNFMAPESQRTLAAVVSVIGENDCELAAQFAPWLPGGEYADYFNHAQDAFDLSEQRIFGMDVAALTGNMRLLVPIFSYLMYKVTQALDGQPAMIVLDEAWALLDNPWFAPRLEAWLTALRRRNAIAILATEHVGEALHSPLSAQLMGHIATQIYLPDAGVTEAYHHVFGLTEHECHYVGAMSREDRHFLLKHASSVIVAELNLDGMNDIMAVLSARPEHLEKMQAAIAAKGEETGKWVPEFLKIL